MSNKSAFKTVSEAVDYCSKHGLKKSAASEDLFETADALLRAYRSGQSSSNQSIDVINVSELNIKESGDWKAESITPSYTKYKD